jgi:hypothetical protein
MKLAEIAKNIDIYLKRFEADGAINRPSSGHDHPYYGSCAWASGSRVGIRYVSYQGESHLTKTDALLYLAWLDHGFVGKHWKALEK